MTTGNDKEETERLAMSAPKVQSFLEGRQIRKIIVFPERLVNTGYNQKGKYLGKWYKTNKED